MSDSSCCSSRLTGAQRGFLQVCVHGRARTWNPQLVWPFMLSHVSTRNTFLLECSRHWLPRTPESALSILGAWGRLLGVTVALPFPSHYKGYFLLIPGRQWLRVFLNDHKLPLHGVSTGLPCNSHQAAAQATAPALTPRPARTASSFPSHFQWELACRRRL